MEGEHRFWHLTFSSDGRMPLFPDAAARRRVIWRLAAIAGREMILFTIVDDHLHQLLRACARRVARLKGSLLRALRPIASAPIEPANVRPVETRAHMRWLFDYLLTQASKHRLGVPDALWDGSCFQDLVGARQVDGLLLPAREALPRFRMREAYAAVGLPTRAILPADDRAVRDAGAARLTAAAASAMAADPTLEGKSPPVVRARCAAAQLSRMVGIPLAQLPDLLGASLRTVQRLAASPVDRAAHGAVRMRITLEDVVAT